MIMAHRFEDSRIDVDHALVVTSLGSSFQECGVDVKRSAISHLGAGFKRHVLFVPSILPVPFVSVCQVFVRLPLGQEFHLSQVWKAQRRLVTRRSGPRGPRFSPI